jgi:hypothetical protein
MHEITDILKTTLRLDMAAREKFYIHEFKKQGLAINEQYALSKLL